MKRARIGGGWVSDEAGGVSGGVRGRTERNVPQFIALNYLARPGDDRSLIELPAVDQSCPMKC